MSHLATLYPYNKRLMIICQPLLIPPTVWSHILFAPFSQVKCSPVLWLTRGSSVCTGQVYYVSKGSLKIANKQYTSVKNDYEMTLNGESTVIPCEDSSDVPMVQCDFVSIGDLENRDKDAIIGKEHKKLSTQAFLSPTCVIKDNCNQVFPKCPDCILRHNTKQHAALTTCTNTWHTVCMRKIKHKALNCSPAQTWCIY